MYLLAAIIGVLAYVYVPALVLIGPLEIWAGVPTERMGRFLIADLAMTFFIYGCSVAKKNGSAYDAYWSVIPFYLVLALVWNSASQTVGWAQWATAILVSAWSWRLTLNWARGWTGWDHEDWRYVDFRKSHGRAFELTNLFGIHLFPTVIVFAGCLGLFWVFEPRERDAIWYALGLVVGFIGVALEFLADNELARFRQRPTPSSEDILDTGIWGRLRYPNYLGEMMFLVWSHLLWFRRRGSGWDDHRRLGHGSALRLCHHPHEGKTHGESQARVPGLLRSRASALATIPREALIALGRLSPVPNVPVTIPSRRLIVL